MRNLVKTIKKIVIVSVSAVIASCSSGGTGTIEGLNLTGTWQGVIQSKEFLDSELDINSGRIDVDEGFVAIDVLLNIAQDRTVGITGGPATSQITYSITFIRSSNSQFPCGIATEAGQTATLTFNARNPIITGDGFSAVANNGTIDGQLVVEGDDVLCGGPIRLNRT